MIKLLSQQLCVVSVLLITVTSLISASDEYGGTVAQSVLRQIQSIPDDELVRAIKLEEDIAVINEGWERAIAKSRIQVENGSVSLAQYFDGLPSEATVKLDLVANLILRVGMNLRHSHCRKLKISNYDCAIALKTIALPQSLLRESCLNLTWNARTPPHMYRRLLNADYKDGFHKLRAYANGSELPPPRTISQHFFEDLSGGDELPPSPAQRNDPYDMYRSVALVQWAQFIEHDLVKTSVKTMRNGRPIECCDTTTMGMAAPRYTHAACNPIAIPDADHFYKKHWVSCLNYVRSALATDCNFGPAEQLNEATGVLDLSQLYGVNAAVANTLRTFRLGMLNYSGNEDAPSLPIASAKERFCLNLNGTCYLAGDSRVNSNPYAITLYTLFLRSHNNIADNLHTINPLWPDEKLYATARRINIAVYQKIVYDEWIKIVIGTDGARQINRSDHHNGRSSATTARVSNEFATAAIRFYNSMMPGDLMTRYELIENNIDHLESTITLLRKEHEILRLQDVFYNPKEHGQGKNVEKILLATLTQPAQAMDSIYVDDLSHLLYSVQKENDNQTFGTDSLALDIMRGRDHGLPGYTQCLRKISSGHRRSYGSWPSVQPFLRHQDFVKLRAIYNTTDGIDLIMGGIAEKPIAEDAVVGQTFAYIIGEQLRISRANDPTFYNHPAQSKLEQTVSGYTAARFICDTTKMRMITKNIFHIPDATRNPFVDCDDNSVGSRLRFDEWKEIVQV